MKKVIKVKCPNCKSQFEYYSSECRPFCSKKCQMIDLGQWFNEEYNIPTASPDFTEMEGFNEFDIPTEDPYDGES
jgi:uncharacterized protein